MQIVLLLVIMNFNFKSHAQITKQQAIDMVMDSVVASSSDSVNVYMDY